MTKPRDLATLGGGTIPSDLNNIATGYLRLPVGTGAQRPGAPGLGMIRYNIDLPGFEGYGSAWAQLATTEIAGCRNAIINGNPTINQRGYVSGTATSGANQYTLDRWRVVTSGQSITWTDSGNVRTVTAPAGGVEQVIEGVNLITGTYTLNWTGTATATVAGNAVAKGGNVSITGGTDTTVRFSNGTFSLAQLESGSTATPFERRSFGQELALCQRYFARRSIYGFGYTTGTGNSRVATAYLPVTMRVAPSVVFTSASGSNVSGQTAEAINTNGFGVFTSVGTSGVYILDAAFNATAEL